MSEWDLGALLGNLEFWKYVSIPVVAAIVGWATNWVAIQLTFYPLEFVGRPPFLGWQGIIPAKARRMAEIFMDSTMNRLGTVAEVFEQMDPQKISRHISLSLRPRMEEYTDEILLKTHPVLWENLPRLFRERVYQSARDALPRLVDNLVQESGERIEELVDLKHMVVTRLTNDRQLLNRLFLECGDQEFRFIIRSGLYFGFLFGLVQLAVWYFYPQWWVLPLFGLIVGWATNWIALNVIFRPLHPKKIGPWIVQGLFLRRQPEVAGVWCHIVTREILTIRALVDEMLNGPRSGHSRSLIQRHMKPLVDESAGLARGLAQVALGPEGIAEIEQSVGHKAVEVSPDPFDNHIFNEGRARVVAEVLTERMAALPSDQFQDLLRPCFQEDEWKLILTGAVLGLLAGTAQLVLVFG
jgi:uncharacterized membrane protein YheB (UPF0754 family)